MTNKKTYYYYEYSVCFWDEIDQEDTFRQGVIAALSFADAVSKISEYYGDDYIISFEKILCCNDALYEFNADTNGFKLEVE